MIAGLRSAFGLLTVVGGSAPPDRRAVVWFAPVGAVVGAAVGATWLAASEVWPAAVAAVLVVAVDLALTGLLHVDGLTDAADGLLPPIDRSRRLEVMRAPDVGAFGVAVVVVVLLGRWATLAAQPADVWLVVGLWTTSRGGMGVALASVRPARSTGMAVAFAGASLAGPVAGTAGALALAAVTTGWWGAAAGCAALATVAGIVAFSVRRIGGVTGDVLGAAGIAAETVGLVMAAAR